MWLRNYSAGSHRVDMFLVDLKDMLLLRCFSSRQATLQHYFAVSLVQVEVLHSKQKSAFIRPANALHRPSQRYECGYAVFGLEYEDNPAVCRFHLFSARDAND